MYQNRLGPSGGIYYPNFVPCFVYHQLNDSVSDFRSIKIWKLKTEILSFVEVRHPKVDEKIYNYSSDPIGTLGYLVGVQVSFCVLSKEQNNKTSQPYWSCFQFLALSVRLKKNIFEII